MATTYLERTQTAGNQRTFTWSVWVKRSELSTNHQAIISSGRYSADLMAQLYFNTDNKLVFSWYNTSAAQVGALWTNRLFRDTSAWYHIVVSGDTTNATAGDRMKMYINGVEETSFGTDANPTLNYDTGVNSSGVVMEIGNRHDSHAENMNFAGLMSHLHLIDGTVYPASTFGETDATTGEWKIKTSPSVTYGTNGAFILKDGNSVTDQSGEGNNFTVGAGTLTNTEDNPSDVFCCANALSKGASITLSNGNTTITNGASWQSVMGTLGVSKGKYYWENKVASLGTINAGITMSKQDGTTHSSVDATRIMYSSNGTVYRDALGTSTDTGTTFTTGDIIGISLDCDNGILKFYKNDVLIDTSTNSIITDNEWCPAWGVNGGSFNVNFGNGYFGTTAISSEGTNASNIGKFEYDVPTGFTALSTKGLNE